MLPLFSRELLPLLDMDFPESSGGLSPLLDLAFPMAEGL